MDTPGQDLWSAAELELSEMAAVFARETDALRLELARCQDELQTARRERDELWQEMLLMAREPHRTTNGAEDGSREGVLLRQLDSSEADRLRARRELDLLQSQLEVRLDELASLHAESAGRTAALQDDLCSCENARAEAIAELEELTALLQSRASEIEGLKTSHGELQVRFRKAEAEQMSTTTRIEELHSQLDSCLQELSRLHSAAARREDELQSELAVCRDERDRARVELAVLQHQLEERLNSLNSHLSGHSIESKAVSVREEDSSAPARDASECSRCIEMRSRCEQAISDKDTLQSELALLQHRVCARIDSVAAALPKQDACGCVCRNPDSGPEAAAELDRLRQSASGILRNEVLRCIQSTSERLPSGIHEDSRGISAYHRGYLCAIKDVSSSLCAVDSSARSLQGLRIGMHSCLLNHLRLASTAIIDPSA